MMMGNTAPKLESASALRVAGDDAIEKRIAAFRYHMAEFFALRPLEELIATLFEMGFFSAPASRRFHGCYEGGLFDHSLTVTKHLVELSDKLGLKWQEERSPYVIGLLHDLCKCDLYIKQADGSYAYNKAADSRHGVKSMELAKDLIPDLTEEEAMCIKWHMGAYDDKGKWNELGNNIEQFHNVLWTHTADMMAARFDQT